MTKYRIPVAVTGFAILAIIGCGAPSSESTDQAVSSEQAGSGEQVLIPGHTEVTAANLKQHLEDDSIVLLKFGAPWCPPCKKVDLELDKLKADNGDKLTVIRVNVDEDPGLAEDYAVSVLPAIFLFKDGKQVKEWGIADASEMQESIDEIQ